MLRSNVFVGLFLGVVTSIYIYAPYVIEKEKEKRQEKEETSTEGNL